MAKEAPHALILGHSFVRRLRHDLETSFDSRANISFNLLGTASVFMHGVGGRTVPNLRAFDLHEVKRLSPDIVILELGTNDLSYVGPEVVGSAIDDLVRLLLDSFSVRVDGVCHVIPRVISDASAQASFLERASALNSYTRVVLEELSNVFCWEHKDFASTAKDFYRPDGVHLNFAGQYLLYRSYRGAILKAIQML